MTLAPSILALTGALTAWVPLDPAVRWADADQPVSYCINANATRTAMSTAEVVAAIEAGAAAWDGPDVGGDVACTAARLARRLSGCRPRTDAGDGVTNVFFRRDWPHGSATLGITRYRTGGADCGDVIDDAGQPWDLRCHGGADVELNDDRAWWGVGGAVGADLTSVAAHELGHVLGLGHCNDNQTCELRGAIMHAAYTGGALRDAADDDIEGLCALYPRRELELGAACETDAQCASGVCAAGRSGERFCSVECPASCPAGLSCQDDAPASRSACRPSGSAAPSCAVCDADALFACGPGAACVVDAGIDPTCLELCRETAECPQGFICSRATDGAGRDVRACVPPSGDCSAPMAGVVPAGLLEACVAADCVGAASCESYCAAPCSAPADCPDGQRCVGRIDEMVCLPEAREGEPCDDRHVCAVGVCVTAEDGPPICHRACVGGGPCRADQTCERRFARPGAAIEVCVPAGPSAGADAGVDAGSSVDAGPVDGGSPPPDAGPSVCACATGELCNPACNCDLRCAEIPIDGTCSCRTTSEPGGLGALSFGALLSAAACARWRRRRTRRLPRR